MTRSGTRRRNGEIVSQGGSGSILYRTLVAEVTFHRPCAPEECAWGALWLSQNSFARTCVVNTILACTLGLDSQLGAPCNGSGSSLHRTCVAEVTFYRPSATEGLDIQRRRAKQVQDDIFMRTSCNKRMGPPVD